MLMELIILAKIRIRHRQQSLCSTQVTGNEPSTYACVGTKDNIASYRSVEYYIARLESAGTNAEVEVFDGLSHGFGLGEGTVAEGWIDHAVSFWEENSNT